MASIADLTTKVSELVAAVTANGDRTAAKLVDLQAAVDAAKAAADIPDAVMAQLQSAIDALNA